jgi:UDPglucose 6-dehydrogenase
MKVTFFNQLYDAIGREGETFNKVVKAIGSDPRIGHSHTKVPGPDGKQGYGGACFPKDTAALVKFDEGFTLVEKCIRINNEYRKRYELDDREKEQKVKYQ